MEAIEVRLELIKLVFKPHQDVKISVSTAKVLEDYVLKSDQTNVDKHMDREVEAETKPEAKASRSIYKRGNP